MHGLSSVHFDGVSTKASPVREFLAALLTAGFRRLSGVVFVATYVEIVVRLVLAHPAALGALHWRIVVLVPLVLGEMDGGRKSRWAEVTRDWLEIRNAYSEPIG